MHKNEDGTQSLVYNFGFPFDWQLAVEESYSFFYFFIISSTFQLSMISDDQMAYNILLCELK